MTSPSHLKSHSQLLGGNGAGRSVGSSAKIGLVGVLALIVLVVALWDKSDDPAQEPETQTANAELGALGATVQAPTVTEVEPLAPVPTPPAVVEPAIADAQELPAGPLAPVPTPAVEPAAQPVPAPAPVPAPRAEVSGQRYQTRVGDSLWKVAERFYGNGAKWHVIAEANDLGESLPHGIEIVIPDLPGATTPAAVTPTAQAPNGFELYEVKANDSLWKIAERTLGDGARWPEIQKVNREVLLGANDDVVRVGMKLKIPRSS